MWEPIEHNDKLAYTIWRRRNSVRLQYVATRDFTSGTMREGTWSCISVQPGDDVQAVEVA